MQFLCIKLLFSDRDTLTLQTPFSFSLDSAASTRLVLDAALPALPDHFDELRSSSDKLRPPWQRFFDFFSTDVMHSLDACAQTLAQQVREEGITHNLYGDRGVTPQSWPLAALPFILAEEDWAILQAGIAQRAQLINTILQDMYGAQTLLSKGLLPPALVFGHPGYLRALKNYAPPGGIHLHILAFDVVRTSNNQWAIAAQRTQAPSGLGYALENRSIIAKLFPQAFHHLQVQSLAPTYQQLTRTLCDLCVQKEHPRMVLLTPGPCNETYFEQVSLARYLDISLVQGSDLMVQDETVYLKTLTGLQRVDIILRRLDDDFCDPVEMRADSTLGSAGLLQAMRAGNVLIANVPGSGVLESLAINAFLPAIAEHFGEKELLLPSLPTWWCGDVANNTEQTRPPLAECVIYSTYPDSAFPVVGSTLDAQALAYWQARIAADPNAYTLQSLTPFSLTPTWVDGQIVPRAAMLRLFAISDGQGGYTVMPGGLTRSSTPKEQSIALQRGGSSLDTWVLRSERTTPDTTADMLENAETSQQSVKHAVVSSHSAENLFWLGRYSERAENTVRLCRLLLDDRVNHSLVGGDFLSGLGQLAVRCALVPENTISPQESLHGFTHALLASVEQVSSGNNSIHNNLIYMQDCASQVRDWLGTDHWRLVVAAHRDFAYSIKNIANSEDQKKPQILASLEHLAQQLSTIDTLHNDAIPRDEAWRLQAIGRQLERLHTVGLYLATMLTQEYPLPRNVVELLLQLFATTFADESLHADNFKLVVLLNLLVMDRSNPRAEACIIASLRAELDQLPRQKNKRGNQPALVYMLPSAELGNGVGISLEALGLPDANGSLSNLRYLCESLRRTSVLLSDEMDLRYFSHADRYLNLVAT